MRTLSLKRKQPRRRLTPACGGNRAEGALPRPVQVTEGVYQIRGFDLSVMSIIETDTGYIVVTADFSRNRQGWHGVGIPACRPKTDCGCYLHHSHIDHWGGVKGVISEADVNAGKVKVIAPEHFLEHAISENIIAGNVMSRRATYMYGNLLPKDVERAGGRRVGANDIIGVGHPDRADRLPSPKPAKI